MRDVASGASVAAAGMIALAVAMGIGRFAFTPLLPMMQHDRGLTLAQGGWLASANYLGYFLGAVYASRSRLRAREAILASLLVISATTLAAAFVDDFAVLLVLRLLPGVASALVLVYVSAWSMESLAKAGRSDLGPRMFSGVGVGIVCAGLLCLALVAVSASSGVAWAALGGIALAGTLFVAASVRGPGEARAEAPDATRAASLASQWKLIFAHGAFGFGYIIPATFLPVMAKHALGDTPLFGWAWPVFGLAAAASTLVYGRISSRLSVRAAWAGSLVIMAAGVVCPVFLPNIAGIVVAAIAVGATFMVATMLGMQEARREAGAAARALMGAMTSAFALGQIVGPLAAASATSHQAGFSVVLVAASIPLVAAAWLLYPLGRARLRAPTR